MELLEDITPLTPIGEADTEYQATRETARDDSPAFEGEEEWTNEELAEKIAYFMGDIWTDFDADDLAAGSEGYSASHGSYIGMVPTNDSNEVQSALKVDISRKGGHIVNVHLDEAMNENMRQPQGEMGKEEAQAFSKDLIERWGEEEMVVGEVEQLENKIHFTFYPEKDDISLENREVTMEVDTQDGVLVEFRALAYFALEQEDVELEPFM